MNSNEQQQPDTQDSFESKTPEIVLELPGRGYRWCLDTEDPNTIVRYSRETDAWGGSAWLIDGPVDHTEALVVKAYMSREMETEAKNESTILQDRSKLPKTQQEIFDHVVRHLEKQGWERSLSSQSACLYRTDDGKACAVGCLIPDDAKSDSGRQLISEFGTVYGLSHKVDSDDIELRGFLHGNIEFLRQLQHDHDLGDTPEGMRSRLRSTAAQFNLTLPDALKEQS